MLSAGHFRRRFASFLRQRAPTDPWNCVFRADGPRRRGLLEWGRHSSLHLYYKITQHDGVFISNRAGGDRGKRSRGGRGPRCRRWLVGWDAPAGPDVDDDELLAHRSPSFTPWAAFFSIFPVWPAISRACIGEATRPRGQHPRGTKKATAEAGNAEWGFFNGRNGKRKSHKPPATG